MAAVVNKAWAGAGCSNASLSSSLAAMHALFVLLNRPLTRLLENDAEAFFARRVLQPFLDEAGAQLLSATLREPAALPNPLGMQAGVPLLPLPEAPLLNVQCLVNRLLLAESIGGERLCVGALAFWQGHLLWGSPLQLRGLEAIALLVRRTLWPAADRARKVGGICKGSHERLSPHVTCREGQGRIIPRAPRRCYLRPNGASRLSR